MRKAMFLSSIILLLSSSPITAQQRDMSQVEVEVTRVQGNVWLVTGLGGNIGLSIGEDGVVMVDDQYAPLAERIEKAIRSVTDAPLRFVINTHHHGDHVGGNEYFGRQAPVVAQTNVRKRLEQQVTAPERPLSPRALPVLTFDHGISIFNGEEIRVFHLPHAHTDNDSVVHFTGSNVVHLGDLFFHGRFPFIDLDSGGSVRGLIAAIETILESLPSDARVIPGHGPLATTADLRGYANMLRETATIVTAALREGKSLEQMKSENVLAEYENLSWQFITAERYLEILHRDLK